MHDSPDFGHRTQSSVDQSKKYGLALGDTMFWMNKSQVDHEMDTISKLGTIWIRVDLSWQDIQPDNATKYDWAGFDRIVTSANKHDIRVLPILAYTPKWARPQSCNYSQQCVPANFDQFASFANKAVDRYSKQGVHTWEIWNEPNLGGSWKPEPNPKEYAKLLKVTYESIKKVDPNAKVISGGMGPLDQSPVSINQLNFLGGMYAAGAKLYFDALGYHPYSFPAPPNYVINWSSWSMMADLPNNLRRIMAANGDSSKQIWITEFGAPTNGPHGLATTTNYNLNGHPDHVNEALQAKTMELAVKQYQRTPWLGAYFWYDYQDLGTSKKTNENFFGLLRFDGSKKPAYYSYMKAIDQSNK
ncbi:MAG TPA: cellulase family glycosylhydrolase [Candidatus Saccharimonadales bacterium]|nr:cellulase family glycosylhydrolase [Candidatus Saccharimonadales bacterium]